MFQGTLFDGAPPKPHDSEAPTDSSPNELSDQPLPGDDTPRTHQRTLLAPPPRRTAPTYDNRVAGHHALLVDPTSGRLLKVTDSLREVRFYADLADRARCDDGVRALMHFFPKYFGTRASGSSSADATASASVRPTGVIPSMRTSAVVELEDLCAGYAHPCIIDLKMGTRQYGLDSTEDKRRSKLAKARQSTTQQLGVRLGGMRLQGAHGTVRQRTSTEGLRLSVGEFTDEVRMFIAHARSPLLRASLTEEMVRLRAAMAQQRSYHFFTTSLLWVYDAAKPRGRVAIIDFAHTHTTEERAVASADEGYLRGIDTLLMILSDGP